MYIDYMMSAYNEVLELKGLVYYLLYFLDGNDSIVLTIDDKHATTEMRELVQQWNNYPQIKCHFLKWTTWHEAWKTSINWCTNELIFGLCPDEVPTIPLIQEIKNFAKQADSSPIDAIAIPRINIYSDLTKEKIANMYTGNRPQDFLLQEPINEHGWHCWPDHQIRIHKKRPYIYYGNEIHSGIVGYKQLAVIPADPKLALLHVKTIEHQERILKRYDEINL